MSWNIGSVYSPFLVCCCLDPFFVCCFFFFATVGSNHWQTSKNKEVGSTSQWSSILYTHSEHQALKTLKKITGGYFREITITSTPRPRCLVVGRFTGNKISHGLLWQKISGKPLHHRCIKYIHPACVYGSLVTGIRLLDGDSNQKKTS